jgi:hypothetical protein
MEKGDVGSATVSEKWAESGKKTENEMRAGNEKKSW